MVCAQILVLIVHAHSLMIACLSLCTHAIRCIASLPPSPVDLHHLRLVGVVIDACNGFRRPEDASCVVKLLSSILGDTANVQLVALLPKGCAALPSQWISHTPSRMTRQAHSRSLCN